MSEFQEAIEIVINKASDVKTLKQALIEIFRSIDSGPDVLVQRHHPNPKKPEPKETMANKAAPENKQGDKPAKKSSKK